MEALNMALQLAPAHAVIEAVRKIDLWPSLEAQEMLADQLGNPHRQKYPAPAKWDKHFFKCLEREIMARVRSVEGDEEVVSDSLMELIVQAQTNVGDDTDSGYVSFPTGTEPVPIRVIRSHNQVGLKVWSAGIFLAEVLQRTPGLLKGRVLLELGAGVGITGLILARSEGVGIGLLIMTDFHEGVVDNLRHNVELGSGGSIGSCGGGSGSSSSGSSSNGNGSSGNGSKYECEVVVDLLDWSTVSEADFVQYGARVVLVADCTYSEVGNVPLVGAMRRFLKAMEGERSVTATGTGVFGESALQYVERLVQGQVPCVLIACTVRGEATFEQFLDLLDGSSDLQYKDVTDWGRACFSDSEPLYYYPEDRGQIKILCIHSA